jgi:hypothetical protein
MQQEPRIAILGPAGIGKTSLARTAMHHPEVDANFSGRHFVSCESSHTVEDLTVAVALALGLELSEKLSPKIIQYLYSQNSCLLLLDNFETPWEPIEGRAKVEQFLSLLASLPNLALLVRGFELSF